jgi:hypothetical protein
MIRVYLAAAALSALLLSAPLVARADPADQFVVAIAPGAVQPPGAGAYTLAITNLAASPHKAMHATVSIPAGFTIDAGSLQATVSGPCTGTWIVVPSPTSIDLAAPDADSALCPGATLTLSMTVLTAPPGDGSYVWTTDVSGGFNIQGPQPTLLIDGTPPETTIQDGPPDPNGSGSATFEFTGADTGAGVDHFECALDGAGFAGCASPTTYNGVPDGPHTFQVRAVDAVGNSDSSPEAYTWTIDTVHPRVTLTDKPPLLTNRTTASFSFSADHPGSTFECRLDGAPFAACMSPKPYSGLGDGSHTFAVRAISLGNPGLPTTYSWTVDTVAPQTTVVAGPPAQSTSSTAGFTFTSSELGSTFACSLDAAGFTPCASPKSYAGLGDGQHVFRVQAVDAAGNADGSPAVYTWQIAGVGPPTVDLTPPANVSRLRRTVGYGRLQLRWRKPRDRDFDHVALYVSTSPKSQPRTLVYRGKRQSYTNKRFKNGLYYRYLVVSYDHAQNASRGRTTRVPASVLLKSPRNGGVVRSGPIFRWSAVRRAIFYNVQLYYANQKVLSAWPRKPRQRLTQHWTYRGRHYSLRKGAYTWFVWPAFGSRAKSHYGQLLGQGTFRVR